ncbi:MAG: Tat pathway signal protein [Bryobacteraceae bacterium]|jgi:hypothetical protein
MDRRQFLQSVAATAAMARPLAAALPNTTPAPICEFQLDGVTWKVYEDLHERDGALTFVSSQGERRVFAKSAEATFAEANPPWLGLSLKDIGLSAADLLADRLLANGDPDPELVKSAAPPLASTGDEAFQRWTSFVGTKEAFDTAPVFYGGDTRTYHPMQNLPELHEATQKRRLFEGLLGGWMPAVRKVTAMPDGAWCEAIVFGDVEARDKFIVQTWHRTALIKDGAIVKVFYGHTYPAFPPARKDPAPEAFYRALLVFADYWDRQLHDLAPASLPEASWIDMSRHAFARELMVRPGGVYPKYGAVDRDYYGSEYDGFQDIFTSAVYTNLEWGRFEMARTVIDNYFSDFVEPSGMVNMRGPETAQFGLTLSLLARYYNYTRDSALLHRHEAKIRATAGLLAALHEDSLRLAADNPGFGLIHGWSESDSCLMPRPMTWWQPYFANSAMAARGFRDLARVWPAIAAGGEKEARAWLERSEVLRQAVVRSVRQNIRKDISPPYIAPLPGVQMPFREAMAKEKRGSTQQWAHRPYCELLQADVLPPELAHVVIDCMRAYGATTLGVVANVEPAHEDGRDILGFISYGYAQMLLRLDRIEEYLLFLYSHRYHDHTRGSWTAGEVAGITGDTATFCIPAQQTIPLLVRWMLVLEDSDADRLYLGRALPRDWLASGKEIRIEGAPTRWGRVGFRVVTRGQRVQATVELERPGAPAELYLKLRLPAAMNVRAVTVNGQPATLGGAHGDTIVIQTGDQRRFEVIAQV